MSFDIPASIEREVEVYAAKGGLTKDEAIVRLIQIGLRQNGLNLLSPIEQGWGMFSSPEDAALLDAAVELIYEERRRPTRRPIDL